MGFVKLFISKEHVHPDRVDETFKRFLKADAVIGDSDAIEVLRGMLASASR